MTTNTLMLIDELEAQIEYIEGQMDDSAQYESQYGTPESVEDCLQFYTKDIEQIKRTIELLKQYNK